MTGVEGYVESAASGLVAGINAARFAKGEELVTLPEETAIGSMAYYITSTNKKSFQPMNANFGLLKDLGVRIKNKQERYAEYAKRAIETIQTISKSL